MGIFDKLTFWKRDSAVPTPARDSFSQRSDLGIERDNVGLNTRSYGLGQDPSNQPGMFNTGMEEQPADNFLSQNPNFVRESAPAEPFQDSSQPSAFSRLNQISGNSSDSNNISKNMEVISIKVDTLKAMLDNLTQKIDKIEKIAEQEDKKPKAGYSRW